MFDLSPREERATSKEASIEKATPEVPGLSGGRAPSGTREHYQPRHSFTVSLIYWICWFLDLVLKA